MRAAIFLFIVCFALACQSKKNDAVKATSELEYIASPAGPSSAEPYLFTDQNNNVYLSWIEQQGDTNFFKFSKWINGQWSEPSLIATGSSWFVNWADYPMIATDGKSNFISHILDKSGAGTYSYDVKIFASADSGSTWSSPAILHDDGKQAEHGFMSLIPYKEGFFVSWLDGRNTGTQGMSDHADHGGHQGAMTIRAAILDKNGRKSDEWELDNKTCDCCQTTVAITDNGPVVVYRDRSDEEIRDMNIVRLVNGTWTKPQPVFTDHWKINGCPVNGPRSASIGNDLAVAWYTAPEDSAMVNVIFSADGGATFGKPIRIDEGNAIGRVDVVMVDNHSAMVSWMEGGNIRVIKVDQDGKKGIPFTVYPSSEARSSGFPQMTLSKKELFFAWTDDNDQTVKVARLAL